MTAMRLFQHYSPRNPLTPWMPPIVSLLVSVGLAAGRIGHMW